MVTVLLSKIFILIFSFILVSLTLCVSSTYGYKCSTQAYQHNTGCVMKLYVYMHRSVMHNVSRSLLRIAEQHVFYGWCQFVHVYSVLGQILPNVQYKKCQMCFQFSYILFVIYYSVWCHYLEACFEYCIVHWLLCVLYLWCLHINYNWIYLALMFLIIIKSNFLIFFHI